MKSLQERLSSRSRLEIWLLAHMDRWRWLLLAFPILISIAGFNGTWRVRPDAIRHMRIADAIATQQDLSKVPESNIEKRGLADILALGMEKEGKHTFLYAHLIMLGLGWACLVLTYFLFWLYDGRPLAVAMTFLLGMTEHFLLYQFELLTELPFLLGMLLMLIGWQWIMGRRPDHLLSGRQAREYLKMDDDEEDAPAEAEDIAQHNDDEEANEHVSAHTITTNGMLSPEADRASFIARYFIGLVFMISGVAFMWYFRSVAVVAVAAMVTTLGWLCLRHTVTGPKRLWWGIAGVSGVLACVSGLLYFLFYTAKGRMIMDPEQYEHTDEQMAFNALKDMKTMVMEGRLVGEVGERIADNIPMLFQEALAEAVFGADMGPYIFMILTVMLLFSVVTLLFKKPLWFFLILLYILQQIPFWVTDRYFLPLIVILLFAWWHLFTGVPEMIIKSILRLQAFGAWLSVREQDQRKAVIRRRVLAMRVWLRRFHSKGWAIGLRLGWLFALAWWFFPNTYETIGLLIEQQEVPFYQHYKRARFMAPHASSMLIHEKKDAEAKIIIDTVYEYEDGRFYRDKLRRDLINFYTDHEVSYSFKLKPRPDLHEAVYYLHREAGDGGLAQPVDLARWKKLGAWPGEKGDVWTLYKNLPADSK